MSQHYQKLLSEFSLSLPASLATVRAPVASPLNGFLGVSLKPCETENEPSVAKWLMDTRLAPLWGEYHIPEHASSMDGMNILRSRGIFLSVALLGKPDPLGFVCARIAPSPRRHLTASIFLEDRYRGFGYGPAAFAVFLRYLFQSFDVPQVLFEVYGWDLSGLRAMAHLKEFRLEGVRRDHYEMDGKPHDLYELAMTREDFESLSRSPLFIKLVSAD